MATLTGTLAFERFSLIFELTGDPNVTPRYVLSGTAGSVSNGAAMFGKPETISQEGAVRTYGNGNMRAILGATQTKVEQFAMRTLSAAQVATLNALIGHTVVYMDTYGRRVIGVYLGATIVNIPLSGNLADYNILIQAVTYSEAV